MTTVRVYCRVRPFNKREISLGDLRYPIEVGEKEIFIPERKKRYGFDYNFDEKSSQEEVFQIVGHAVIGLVY